MIFIFVGQFLSGQSLVNSIGTSICDRFLLPEGFERIELETNEFGYFLRHLPLKSHNENVKYYNGEVKTNYNVYDAVIDLYIGKKNLHQCADAIMRLKAEHHWNQKEYEKIHFNFSNGKRVEYSEWMKGRRMIVNGNKTSWNNRSNPSNTYSDFWNYMELIFMYAGTASLEKEMEPVRIEEMKIGDVFIKGGYPGHAALVVDMAVDSETGEKLFLLGQSYMPAQDFQLLKNPNDSRISPWYRIDDSEILLTPEWRFTKDDLKRFAD
ncbi:DUF4846 domain-containing protein [Portibacter lacus]|uniref:DUF4846 domain-containing protein n=1 Tax=Portibacter lacus TaxID=1099794 RepID=UPI001F4434F7|nr:DUF4846 domain-containing protein [Portibacter lacus]